MNTFKKYCEGVFVAECEEQYSRGDLIELTTKYGKEAKAEVYNLVQEANGKFYYSIVRYDLESYAKRKADKYSASATLHKNKSNAHYEASQEGRDFLALAEPIKVGHHSESRHRALIDRNWKRMGKSVEESKKAEEYQRKADYWKAREKDITLAMPESLDFYAHKLEEAKKYHAGLKDGSIPKAHGYSMQYANKAVKDLTRKHEIAVKLWGER